MRHDNILPADKQTDQSIQIPQIFEQHLTYIDLHMHVKKQTLQY